MRLFYKPDITVSTKLSEEESKHCIKVLRMKKGDALKIINGKGTSYECEIIEDHHKKCEVKRISKQHHEPLIPIHIALAPTKNMDRIEWFVEKAVEIGITEISFVLTKNSERKNLRLDRLEKIAISAMKQSHKYYLPTINPLIDISEFVNIVKEDVTLIANQTEGKLNYISSMVPPTKSVCILIGPEGDFTAEEVDKTQSMGFTPISLGPHRLRTETAAVYACTEANMINRS